MKKGELTNEPVKSNFGYHIIELLDERPMEFPPFEQVQQQIFQQLGTKARDDYITSLRSKSKIKKIDPK